MNNTKWDELRLAMYHMELSPKWITLSLNGHESNPDREWFYHFKDGGYDDIVHVDIFVDDEMHRNSIRAAVKRIHLPGAETKDGFRIFGYISSGDTVDYI